MWARGLKGGSGCGCEVVVDGEAPLKSEPVMAEPYEDLIRGRKLLTVPSCE